MHEVRPTLGYVTRLNQSEESHVSAQDSFGFTLTWCIEYQMTQDGPVISKLWIIAGNSNPPEA